MQRQLKFLKGSAVSAGKTTCKLLRKMTGSNTWAAETGCTSSFLHTKTNTSTTVESHCDKKQQDAEEDLENFFLCNLSSIVSNIFDLRYIFYSNIYVASLPWIIFNRFQLLSLLLEFKGYFQSAASLPALRHLSLTKSGISTGMCGRHAAETTYFRRPVSRRL